MLRSSNIVKYAFYAIFILGICSCNSKKTSSDRSPRANQNSVKRTCIPESELLAANIVGGQVVQQTDYDAKLVLMVISDGQLCTAAPIAKNMILTAAHCISKNRTNTFAAFYSSLSCESGFNRNNNALAVKEVFIHEAFNSQASPDQMEGDLAILKLESNIPEGYPVYNLADPAQMPSDSELFIYGYGKTGSQASGSGILRKISMNSDDYKVMLSQKKVRLSQFNGAGICQGDSGGPSLVKIGQELQILGVSSYVVGDAHDVCSKEAFQTLAYSYLEWIKSKLDKN